MVNDDYKKSLKVIKASEKLAKAEEKSSKAKLKLAKFDEKQKNKNEKKAKTVKNKLGKRLKKTRRVLKKKQLGVNLGSPNYRSESVLGDENRFFTGTMEEEKRSMFFS